MQLDTEEFAALVRIVHRVRDAALQQQAEQQVSQQPRDAANDTPNAVLERMYGEYNQLLINIRTYALCDTCQKSFDDYLIHNIVGWRGILDVT